MVILSVSCNTNEEPATGQNPSSANEQQTDTGRHEEIITFADTVAEHVDSFKLYCDAMMEADLPIPPVYQHEIFEQNEEATGKFSKLSKACAGKMKVVVNSAAVVAELESTIKAASRKESDLVILIDRSASMGDHIKKVKEGITQIIDTLRRYKGSRLAIATYVDKNYERENWFTFKSFETDYAAAAQYVKSIELLGNPDWPESVYDAVMECMQNDFWQSQKKCNIILVGDAPPQEKPLCQYSLEDVIKAAKDRKVKMNFYPILILPEIKQVRLSNEDKNKYQEIKGNTTLYPNPCKGILNLAMENTGKYYLELYNVNGEILVSEEYFGVKWSKDISHLPDGVYIMRVIAKDHTFEVFRFVLQR
jgi:hypothetical protein